MCTHCSSRERPYHLAETIGSETSGRCKHHRGQNGFRKSKSILHINVIRLTNMFHVKHFANVRPSPRRCVRLDRQHAELKPRGCTTSSRRRSRSGASSRYCGARARCSYYRLVSNSARGDASVFLRTVRRESDIVSKEMYVFETRRRPLALRPEARRVCAPNLEHGMRAAAAVRFTTSAHVPARRRQAGRYRQLGSSVSNASARLPCATLR